MGEWPLMEKLTIAIPTYNRSDSLNLTLNSLLKNTQIDEVLIHVFDNASEDNTEKMVHDFITENNTLKIVYTKNLENIGFDGNILKCYDQCKTDYLWILSDDDIIFQNSISLVLEEVKDSDIICLNDKTQNGLGLKNIVYNFDQENEIDRWEIISKFVWISRFVAKKIDINVLYFQEYLGTGLIHLALINNLLLSQNKPRFKITTTGIIQNNPHCVFSHNFVNVFVNKFYDFCMIPYSNFSEKTALKVASQNIPFIVDGLKQHKIGNKIFNYDYRFFYLIAKMFKYRCSLSLIFKFITIFAIPTPVMKFFKKAKKPCKEDENKRTFI